MNTPRPEDYYYQIPEYPKTYTAGTVAGRMTDGLGFRFYWATADLRPEDLHYRLSEACRSVEETIDHIYNLAVYLRNTSEKKPIVFPIDISTLSAEVKRETILENIRIASDHVKETADEEFSALEMVFKYPDRPDRVLPFWNELNGPLADALWHTGQLVTLRRMSGNPFNANVNVLTGVLKE